MLELPELHARYATGGGGGGGLGLGLNGMNILLTHSPLSDSSGQEGLHSVTYWVSKIIQFWSKLRLKYPHHKVLITLA